jgi:tRNA threonylcarbamoyladenosine biosynthesis protein TsaB
LALDTAMAACSVALWEDGRVVATRSRIMERGQSEALVPMVQECLGATGWSYADLDLIAATVGPGAFTGIRIGLAAARGMALAAGKPCLGVTTLDVLARAARASGQQGDLLVAIDTKRGDFYAQAFRGTGETSDPQVAAEVDLASLAAPGPVTVIGDGADPAVAALKRRGIAAIVGSISPLPDPGLIAALAAERQAAQQAALPPAPLYLRNASTTTPRNRKSPYRLVPCGPAEASVVAQLLAMSFDDPWSLKDVGEIMAMPGAYGLLALEGSEPVGFILCQLAADEMTVLSIGIAPEKRRRGGAAMLLAAAEAQARAANASVVFLEVGEDNDAARKLYAEARYEEVGRRASYYKRPIGRQVDAIILRKNLKS